MRKTSKTKTLVPSEALPLGGVNLRKYAAIVVASATQGAVSIPRCSEGDLAITWDEHLSHAELNQIQFGPPPEDLPPMNFDH